MKRNRNLFNNKKGARQMVKVNAIKNKKGGFTLIELIAVVAIIGILATVLVPKVGGYMKEAKKTKVIDQSKKVIMAVETYNMKKDNNIDENKNISEILNEKTIRDFIEPEESKENILNKTLNKLTSDMKLSNCRDIVQNGKDFNLKNDGSKKDVFGSIIE